MHETGSPATPKFKVIDAYPVGVPEDPARPARIQETMMRLFDHLAAESAGRRSVSIDLGTRCGSRYVDIQTMQLKLPASDYCSADLFGEVDRRLDEYDGPRNVVIFLAGTKDCRFGGYASVPVDDRPGPDNLANLGGYMSVVLPLDWRVALHEMGHQLGAVQKSAPHNDPQSYHCWDGQDIMCYIGLYPVGAAPALPVCRLPVAPFDCNRDDYFNPDPAPGSYLATHWNTWNNVFLCELEACTPAVPAERVTAPAPVGFAPGGVIVDRPSARPRRRCSGGRRAARDRRGSPRRRCANDRGRR